MVGDTIKVALEIARRSRGPQTITSQGFQSCLAAPKTYRADIFGWHVAHSVATKQKLHQLILSITACHILNIFHFTLAICAPNFPENPALPRNPPGIPTEFILSAIQNPSEFHWVPLNFPEISRISLNSPKFHWIPEISGKSGEERNSRNQPLHSQNLRWWFQTCVWGILISLPGLSS